MPLRIVKDDEKKPGGFKSTQQKGNIVKGKLKSQKELKKITSSDEYKKADYQGKTKMLNVATHLTGGQAKLDKNKNNRIDAEDFKILRGGKKPKKAALGLLAAGAMGALGLKKVLGKKKSATSTPSKMPVGDLIEEKKKELSGKKMGGVMKAKEGKLGEAKDYRKYLQGLKEATKSKSAQRAGRAALKAAKSTTIGKVALGVAGAGMAAKKFIESDKFKDMLKKKMNKKMGGGMIGASQMPGYKTGTSVKARGCKLGRTKPTKIT